MGCWGRCVVAMDVVVDVVLVGADGEVTGAVGFANAGDLGVKGSLRGVTASIGALDACVVVLVSRSCGDSNGTLTAPCGLAMRKPSSS